MLVINNFSYFQTNLSQHCTNIKQKNWQHKPLFNLSSIQKGTTYSAIKVFNNTRRNSNMTRSSLRTPHCNTIYLYLLFIHMKIYFTYQEILNI